MRKILSFGMFGAFGGLLGAGCGEMPMKAAVNIPAFGTSGTVAVWTAAVSVCISLALVVAQNRYLQQRTISARQLWIVLGAGCITGAIAGLAGQVFFGFLIGRFGDTVAGLDGLANLAGWLILGGVLGRGMGFFIPNLPSWRAMLAGILGGIVAAWVRLEIVQLDLGINLAEAIFGRLASAAILGMFLGLVIAVVEAAFREAWIDIFYGTAGEKRTVLLGDDVVTLGSSPECTVFVHAHCPLLCVISSITAPFPAKML